MRRLALVLLLVTGCTAGGPGVATTTTSPVPQTSTGPTSSPSADPPPAPEPAEVARAVRLDGTRMLRETSAGLTVLDLGLRHRPVARPPDVDRVLQVAVSGRTWELVAWSCATTTVSRYLSRDEGRHWSAPSPVGYQGCHAGDTSDLVRLARGAVFTSSTGVGELSELSRSTVGVVFPAAERRGSPARYAFRPDGSYVVVLGFGEDPHQVLRRAGPRARAERSSTLPGDAEPLADSLRVVSGRVLVVGRSPRGRTLFRSDDGGRSWGALAFPCSCSRVSVEPLTRSTWWASGDHGRLAVTRDGGAHWRAVTPPPGRPASAYPPVLVPWTSTAVVVDGWVTTDGGRSWNAF